VVVLLVIAVLWQRNCECGSFDRLLSAIEYSFCCERDVMRTRCTKASLFVALCAMLRSTTEYVL